MCLDEILKYAKRHSMGLAEIYAGISLMGASSAFAAFAYRYFVRHAGAELAAGNVVNGVSAPDHGSKFAAIGIPGYVAGYLLGSNGADDVRLSLIGLDTGVRHCRDLFLNSN